MSEPTLCTPKVTHVGDWHDAPKVAEVRAHLRRQLGDVPMRVNIDEREREPFRHCESCICPEEASVEVEVTVSALLWAMSKQDAETDLREAVKVAADEALREGAAA